VKKARVRREEEQVRVRQLSLKDRGNSEASKGEKGRRNSERMAAVFGGPRE
jgi:hypothetical protein